MAPRMLGRGGAPIVVRLVVSVLVTMAAVSLLGGAFVFWRVDTSLNAQLDQDVRAYRDVGLRALADGGPIPNVGNFRYQILSSSGRVISGDLSTPIVTPSIVARAARSEPQHGEIGWMFDGPSYIWLATRAVERGKPVVVVFAIDRREHDEALRELLGQLAIAGTATLAAAGLVGYRTARAALDPVERYRVAAEAAGPDTRLPVSGGDDELTRLGHTFNDLLDRIEASRERERRFLADASHELRTPLSVMRAEVDVALLRSAENEPSHEALKSLGTQIGRLERLCNALLELEELRASAATRSETVPLDDLVAQAVERARRLPGLLGRRIESKGGGGIEFDAHPHWLEVALDNLVSNAVRYGSGTIEVGARRVIDGSGRPCAEVWARDEGEGMPDSFLPRAFERFARGDESRSSGGTGLGLAIVAEIALLHGGTVVIEGARVALVLPFTAPTGR